MAESTRTARTGALARALGVSNATVQAYARHGQIPYRLTPGQQYRFNIDEVLNVLGRGPLVATNGLGDLFGESRLLVSATTAFRADPISAGDERRLRMRAVRPSAAPSAPLRPTDGANALIDLIGRSPHGVAVAVLHRELVNG